MQWSEVRGLCHRCWQALSLLLLAMSATAQQGELVLQNEQTSPSAVDNQANSQSQENEIGQALSELYSTEMSLNDIQQNIKKIDQDLKQLTIQENKHKARLSQLINAAQRANVDPTFLQRLLSDNPQETDLTRSSFDYIRKEMVAEISALRKATADLQARRDYLNKRRKEQENVQTSRQQTKKDQEKRVQTALQNNKKAQEQKAAVVESFTGQGLSRGLAMPVAGKVVSRFSQNGAGIEIATKKGGSVKAIAAGRVMAVTKEMIVIDHGKDYVSSYGLNGGAALVKVNQTVARGGDIAKSGSNLFFGILSNGQAVDPLKFVK